MTTIKLHALPLPSALLTALSAAASPLHALRRGAARVLCAAPAVPGRGELAGMSDRELSDLGIGRSEIPHVMDAASRDARSCTWRF